MNNILKAIAQGLKEDGIQAGTDQTGHLYFFRTNPNDHRAITTELNSTTLTIIGHGTRFDLEDPKVFEKLKAFITSLSRDEQQT